MTIRCKASTAINANQRFYNPEIVGRIGAMPPRFGVVPMNSIMCADFATARSCVAKQAEATAIDCLTGTGTHIQKLLDAGFSRVIESLSEIKTFDS